MEKKVGLGVGFVALGTAYALGAYLVLNLGGCAPLLGLKSYQSGDTRIEFITGADFSVGVNGVDTVENNRGIAPGTGYANTAKH